MAGVLEPVVGDALAGSVSFAELISADRKLIADVTAAPIHFEDGHNLALLVSRNVTETRQQAHDLRQAQDRFEKMFAESPHGSLILDHAGVIVDANEAANRIFRSTAEELRGATFARLVGLTQAEQRRFGLLAAGDLARLELEQTLRPDSADEIHLLITAIALTSSTGNVENVLVKFVDLSDRRRYELQLAHVIDHDPLTGLPNRRRFHAELEGHLARCQQYGPVGALLLLDVDHFKNINDTLGHSAGDQAIIAVAEALRRRMRKSDVIARLGGDEFAVLLPQADRAGAESVAKELVDLIRTEVRISTTGRARRITASVGVILIADPHTKPSDLLATVDLTMYDAKEAGRNTFVLHDPREIERPRTAARILWTERIAQALEDGTLLAHAQPVLDLRTGAITGAELLVRMLDEDNKIVMPGAFLPFAERSSQITQIDMFMISEAVRVLRHVQRTDPAFVIEVNLSGRSVGHPQMAEHILREVNASGINPAGLVLEITETAAVADIDAAREFAHRITTLGCRFALDDFGAGFGSFYYLKHLSFDYVKIDGEFVAHSPENATDQLILSSIVGIASGLGKKTIAEFVADADVYDVVDRLGVDYAQGYHIAAPEPLSAFLTRIGMPPVERASHADQ